MSLIRMSQYKNIIILIAIIFENIYFVGCGVFAKENIKKGSFLLEYVGERVTEREGEKRLMQQHASHRCYIYFFKYKARGDRTVKSWYVLKTLYIYIFEQKIIR